MKYMLDTNILIYARKNKTEKVLEKLMMCTWREICISSITLAELEYGVSKSRMPEQNKLALYSLLSGISVLPFDDKAAEQYGMIRAELEAKGEIIGSNDLLIAAHASSQGLKLVTHNKREYIKVPGLVIEDWAS